ncbi:MAG: DoxX family protein [Minisyncoccia bacterium]
MQKWFPLVGRVLIGLLFLGGAMKFMSIAMVTGYIDSVGLPMASVIFWVSTIVEVAAALALIFGFKTRLAAWTLFVYTGLTIVFFHNNLADQAQYGMALKNLAIMGGLLYVIMYETGMRKESVPTTAV